MILSVQYKTKNYAVMQQKMSPDYANGSVTFNACFKVFMCC